jgi:hypothetical protein
VPYTQRLVELPLGKRAVAGGDRGEHLGVEFDLAKRYVIVNTKIDLHGDRAHLLGGPAVR